MSDVLRWRRLEEIRAVLINAQGVIERGEFDAFCMSLTSNQDVNILRTIVATGPEEIAARASLLLLTRAGIGDSSDLIRQRLRNRPDDLLSDLYTTAPLVLLTSARDLFDVNALRVLHEFADRPSFVEYVLDARAIPHLPSPECFFWTSTEQVTQFIGAIGLGRPTRRVIQLCRNFLGDHRVLDILRREAQIGEVFALAALAFLDGPILWEYFASIKPSDQMEQIMLGNLIMENLRRGADIRDCPLDVKSYPPLETIRSQSYATNGLNLS